MFLGRLRSSSEMDEVATCARIAAVDGQQNSGSPLARLHIMAAARRVLLQSSRSQFDATQPDAGRSRAARSR